MTMTETELRALVRDVIARLAAQRTSRPLDAGTPASGPSARQHASHAMFALKTGSDADGPCLIEPAVMCNHCGYCRSYGH